jgi:hypothetical protein
MRIVRIIARIIIEAIDILKIAILANKLCY